MDKKFGLAACMESRAEKGQFESLVDFGNFLGEKNPEFKQRVTDASYEEVAIKVQQETGYFAETIIDALNLREAILGRKSEIAILLGMDS